MLAGAACGGGDDMPEKRSLDAGAAAAWGFDGPELSKRSMMELMFDCWGAGELEGGELLPPRISARRSALF